MFRPSLSLALGLGIVLGGATAARAQLGGSTIPSQGGPSARPTVNANPDAALPARVPRAAAIPGAESDPQRVAPADRPSSEMRPTEALFDAINRGDIIAVRNAVNRGAELNARNILGFTPVEVAVDLSRRDIAFLLLSLRGIDGRSEARGRGAEATLTPAQQARAAQQEAQRTRAERQTATRQAAARVAPAAGPAVGPAVAQTPRLFAGDGGAPVPDAGFLGFDGGTRGKAR